METKQERTRRLNREAAARYRARKKAAAEKGDESAKKQREKDRLHKYYATTKMFIKKHADKSQISELRDLMAERVKQLNKKSWI